MSSSCDGRARTWWKDLEGRSRRGAAVFATWCRAGHFPRWILQVLDVVIYRFGRYGLRLTWLVTSGMGPHGGLNSPNMLEL